MSYTTGQGTYIRLIILLTHYQPPDSCGFWQHFRGEQVLFFSAVYNRFVAKTKTNDVSFGIISKPKIQIFCDWKLSHMIYDTP